MRIVIKIISWIALICTVAPAFVYLAGAMELDTMKVTMFVATIVWFVLTPFWMERAKGEEQSGAEAGAES